MTFGFSTYGMKSLKSEDAIGQISRIGFDAVALNPHPAGGYSAFMMTTVMSSAGTSVSAYAMAQANNSSTILSAG